MNKKIIKSSLLVLFVISMVSIIQYRNSNTTFSQIIRVFQKNGYRTEYSEIGKNILQGTCYHINIESDELFVFQYKTNQEAALDYQRINTKSGTYSVLQGDREIETDIWWDASDYMIQYKDTIIVYLGEQEDIIVLLNNNYKI